MNSVRYRVDVFDRVHCFFLGVMVPGVIDAPFVFCVLFFIV